MSELEDAGYVCEGHIEPSLKKQRDTDGRSEQADRDTAVPAAGQLFMTCLREPRPHIKSARSNAAKMEKYFCKYHKIL